MIAEAFSRVFIILLSLFLSGCSADGIEEQSKEEHSAPLYQWGATTGQTIVLWGNKNDLDRPFMRKAFERYEALTGNKLDIKEFTHTELEKKLHEGFSDTQAELPDVFLFPNGTTLLGMDPDKNFHDFTNAPWVDDLTDNALTQTISNGKVVGLPHWEAAIAGILYNKKIFKNLGLKQPRNEDEFFEICQTLLNHGITPMYLPFTEPTMLLYQFPMSGILKDTSLLDDLNDGKINYSDIKAMEKIVDWYRRMAHSGYFGSNYLADDWDGMDKAMKSGKYAMMLCWDTWLYSDFTGDPDEFGIMPAFVGAPYDGAYEGPNLMLLIVNEHSPKKDAAIDFITFMADPYNYNAAFADFHTAPVFRKQTGSLTTPQYDEQARYIEQHLYDSVARRLIRGFSQSDAAFIERRMRDPAYSVSDCLQDMDAARIARLIKLDPRYANVDTP